MDSRQREERINLLGNDLMLAQCLSILAVEPLTLILYLYLNSTEYHCCILVLTSPTDTAVLPSLHTNQYWGESTATHQAHRHTVCAVSSKTILKLINRVGLYSAAICSLQQQTETGG